MASNPPAQCCAVGVKHEGEASGQIKNVAGTPTYLVYPPDKSTENGILVLTDVLGHEFINAQLIADQLAANGYFVLMPDLFHGDPVKLNPPAGFEIMSWLQGPPGHLPDRVDPVVSGAIKAAREEFGVRRLGGIGYCFGAKYVVRFMGATGEQAGAVIDAGHVAHPSFVDPQELNAITGPLSIAAAETDAIFPADKRHQSEGILKELSTTKGLTYQVSLYSSVEHGFAVRADITDKRKRWAKEQAFCQAVVWFDSFLKEGKQEVHDRA